MDSIMWSETEAINTTYTSLLINIPNTQMGCLKICQTKRYIRFMFGNQIEWKNQIRKYTAKQASFLFLKNRGLLFSWSITRVQVFTNRRHKHVNTPILFNGAILINYVYCVKSLYKETFFFYLFICSFFSKIGCVPGPIH